MKYLPDIPRHALFGDASDSNKLFIVPEADVLVELIRTTSGTKMFAKFKGQRVELPAGTAVQFIQVQAISASGGVGFAEAVAEKKPTVVDSSFLESMRKDLSS